MKMRTIIETGRKTSPVVNTSLAALKTQIDVFGQILSDFSSVQSECGRAALLEQCAGGLARLAAALNDTAAAWRRFDSTLSDYKYVFGRRKKGMQPDLPGQQLIDFDQKKVEISCTCQTMEAADQRIVPQDVQPDPIASGNC